VLHFSNEEGGIYSTDYGFAMRDPCGGNTGPTEAYQRDYRWNEKTQLVESRDPTAAMKYVYGSDGERAVKYNEGSRETALYYNRMLQRNTTAGGMWIESKHIFVGETRIATKQHLEGEAVNDDVQKTYYDHLKERRTVLVRIILI
jgi:hypothetical protein